MLTVGAAAATSWRESASAGRSAGINGCEESRGNPWSGVGGSLPADRRTGVESAGWRGGLWWWQDRARPQHFLGDRGLLRFADGAADDHGDVVEPW
jgi:hypothetical protein